MAKPAPTNTANAMEIMRRRGIHFKLFQPTVWNADQKPWERWSAKIKPANTYTKQ